MSRLGVLSKPHIAIVTVNFDRSPEGICTGLLVRALLDAGAKITLITSRKAKLGFSHPALKVLVYPYKPREPRPLIRWWAAFRGEFPDNFYFWRKRVERLAFADDDLPDIFYGRAWPFSSLLPAMALAKRHNKPLALHLSDPIPPPDQVENPKYTAALQRLVSAADMVTFTNTETVRYQSQFVDLSADNEHEKVVIIPHVAPKYIELSDPSSPLTFCYAGAIGAREPVLPIVLNGFSAFHSRHPQASLDLVGIEKSLLDVVARQNSSGDAVRCLPFQSDLTSVFATAETLISFEPAVDKPIWTLTKTIHYLFTNRKILALTSKGSPTERILRDFPESCVIVNEYDERSFVEGLERVSELRPGLAHFEARRQAVSEYEGENVAKKLLSCMQSCIQSSS